MEFYFKLVLFLLALVVQSGQKNPALQPSNSEEEKQISFVTTLCKQTVDMSKQALFYVLNINPDFPIQSFVQNLHENLIGTVVITNHIWLNHSAIRQPTKNIIIFLNELDEIPSLILDSASASDETVGRAKRASAPKLNRFCIQNDDFDLIDVNKTCDFNLRIRRSELNGDSDLTDSVSKLTRGLFANRIWNSNNYIIFTLPKISTRGRHNFREHQLAFLFKFFWRFFKGLRTILCIDFTCYNHDTFLSASPDRAFKVGFLDVPRVHLYGGDTYSGFWRTFAQVTSDLDDELKCRIIVTEVANPKHIDLHEKALKSNLDMLVFEATDFPLRDVAMFDFSAAIQSCSFCFAAPRSGFVPQSILPFKCFSLEVWTVILIAVLTIYAAIRMFHYLQRTRFNRLYSEREQLTFEHTSVILYLYSFLVTGSPPRLLLGQVISGKILFMVVSLFVLIIVTVLQSEMTTLLSKSLRYPEIDTLEDLSNSNLFIQTSDLEISLERLQDYGFYNSLKNKLTEGHFYYSGILSKELAEGTCLNYTELWYTMFQKPTLSAPLKRVVDIRSNVQSIMQSDAFEVAVFNLHQRNRANFYAVENMLPDVLGEFHLVKECVLTYPQTFIIQRNSYLSEFYMQKIISYVEAGIVENLSNDLAPYIAYEDFILGDGDNDPPPEAFTMQHLQPAFIALGLGLTLSTIIFAVELSVDVLKESRFSKFARCIERFVRPSSLWA